MSMPAPRGVGVVRSATCTDAAALSRLMAAAGVDNLPVTCPEIRELMERGDLLVLDLGSGTLGAAAHLAVLQAGRERRAVFRYVAVHPDLAGRGVEDRLTSTMLERCDTSGAHSPCAPARCGPLDAARRDTGRRLACLAMLVLALLQVIGSAGQDDAAVVMLVWSTLALIFTVRAPRMPRAVARCRRGTRLFSFCVVRLIRCRRADRRRKAASLVVTSLAGGQVTTSAVH